jgi:hypothetical protein
MCNWVIMEHERKCCAPESVAQTKVGNVMKTSENKDRSISHFHLLQLDVEGTLAQNGCSTDEVMR